MRLVLVASMDSSERVDADDDDVVELWYSIESRR
jgi:hypothetical protein